MGTKAVTGTLLNSTSVLHMGGNDRALSQAEIQTDMSTAVR